MESAASSTSNSSRNKHSDGNVFVEVLKISDIHLNGAIKKISYSKFENTIKES